MGSRPLAGLTGATGDRVASSSVSTQTVSILLPVLDEVAGIEACLDSLEAQDYAGPMEILIADGGSTDGTLELIAHRRATVIANPRRVQSHGVNLAAERASGEILIRADAHTTYAPDYVSRSVAVLAETGATVVGGPIRPLGTTRFGGAVAGAMRSRLGIGPGAFHHADRRRQVDTVYLGAFRRSEFLALGGMRTLPSGVAEDADLYFRWRQQGGVIIVDPSIRSTYLPRQTPGALWRQFYRYGRGKADMLRVNRRWPSWRPLAPLLLVLGLVAGSAIGPLLGWWPLAGLASSWMMVLIVAGRARPLTVFAAAIMHLSYGIGLLRGVLG